MWNHLRSQFFVDAAQGGKSGRDRIDASRHEAVGATHHGILLVQEGRCAELRRRQHRRHGRITAEADDTKRLQLTDEAARLQSPTGQHQSGQRFRQQRTAGRRRGGNSMHRTRRKRAAVLQRAPIGREFDRNATPRQRDAQCLGGKEMAPRTARSDKDRAVRFHPGLDPVDDLGARTFARDGDEKSHAERQRDQRRATIGDERQGHAFGRHHVQIDRHVDGALDAEQNDEARRGETAERILVARCRNQPAQHDEGEDRDDRDASDDTELLAGHRENEIGMAIRQDPFQRALARPLAEPTPGNETLQRGIDLERVAGRHAVSCVEEFLDADADMRHQLIGEKCTAHPGAADADDPEPMQARHDEERRPDDRKQHRLAEVGLQNQRHDGHRQQEQSQRYWPARRAVARLPRKPRRPE